jgi:hypothetical protein
MSVAPDRLRQGLEALGAMLDATGAPVELAIVGGGALILSGVHVRPTEDLDVVALRDGKWEASSPLPAHVIGFVRDVGRAYDLPVKQAGKGTDWLNANASFLMPDDLPPGFFERTTAHQFGALTLHVPDTIDLVALKILAATSAGRGSARQRDVQDLVKLAPTAADLADSLRWVSTRRPAADFWPGRARQILDDLEAAGLADPVAGARALLFRNGEAS